MNVYGLPVANSGGRQRGPPAKAKIHSHRDHLKIANRRFRRFELQRLRFVSALVLLQLADQFRIAHVLKDRLVKLLGRNVALIAGGKERAARLARAMQMEGEDE